ncbi:MAG: hypothetical protein ACHQDE_08355 [Acidimicrobiia bacterium]
MSNPSLLFAIAGISMSFAGFASLFLALRPHDSEWQRYEVAQLNAIVLFALTALFSALLVVPIASLIGTPTALRVMSAAVLVLALYEHEVKVGTSWLKWSQVQGDLPRREFLLLITPFALVAFADQALLLINIVSPTEALYELALVTMLATPAFVFVLAVARFGSGGRR